MLINISANADKKEDNMRKWFVCVLLGLVLTVTACGSGTKTEDNSTEDAPVEGQGKDAQSTEVPEDIVEIEFWHSSPFGVQAELMTKLLEDFMVMHPNIKVKELGLTLGDSSEKLTPALAAGTGPDLVANSLDSVKERAIKQQIVNMQQYVTEWGLDTSVFFPATVEACMYEGSLYALPYITDTRVLFYNKDHFREAGLDPEKPPTTWKEVLEYNEKLTVLNDNGVAERVGFTTRIGEAYPWVLGWSFGAELWNDDGTPNINSPEMLEALNFAIEIQEQVGISAMNGVTENWAASGYVNPFIAEITSMTIAYNGFYATLATDNPDLDYGVALIPTKDGINYKTSWAAGYSLEIVDKGDEARARAAFELAAYLCDVEAATALLIDTSEYVCNMKAYEDPRIQDDPMWKVFVESGKNNRYHHFLEEYPTWHYGILQPEWDAALLGTKSPEQALKDADDLINTVIENYKLMSGG